MQTDSAISEGQSGTPAISEGCQPGQGPVPGLPSPRSPGPGAPRLPTVGPPPRSPTGLQSQQVRQGVRVLLQCGDLRRLQCPVRREAIPLEATFALAIGLLLLNLRSRRSPSAPHSRAFDIQQVDSGLAGVACAFDRRHHPKGEVRGGGKQVLGLHWCVLGSLLHQ